MSRELRLVGAIAVRPAILTLIPEFEAATGYAVLPRWELNPIIKQQLAAGEPFDLVIINPGLVAELASQGRVDPVSQLPLGRIAMGVGARAGSAPLDLSSVDAFKRALGAAASIAYANQGTSGSTFVALLERLGISADVLPKLRPTSGGQTAAAVAHGDAELAVIPVSSILAAAPEVVLAGRFPTELQSYIDFAIGISTGTQEADAAVLLSRYLTSVASAEVLAAAGFERD